MKIKNIILALKDQGPFTRFIKNLYKGHIFGLFHKRSHFRDDGIPKVAYSSKESAIKASKSMMKKYPTKWFSNYKCIRCSGFHLGKNRENK